MSDEADFNRARVVLCRPIYPRNIGMCARAAANMGASRLIIVDPQCDLGHEAKQGAAHAQEILASSVVYDSLQSFFETEGEGVRIALSGHDWRLKTPDNFQTLLQRITREPGHLIKTTAMPIYLIFGCEDLGLSAEEMELCHYICSLPTYGTITSLNLSHAVLLTLFILRQCLDESSISSKHLSAIKPDPVYHPGDKIRNWLEALGFDLSSKRINVEKTLNRILLSRTPTADELRTLDAVIHQTIRKLTDKKQQ